MLFVNKMSTGYGLNPVIKDLTFSAKMHEVISFIGPNGSGKSTLFKCLKQQKRISSGSISWTEGKLPKCAAVEQSYRETLLPWLTVRQNICFPLKIKRLPKQICELKLEELLTDLPVQLPLTAKAARLSGGQAQLTVLLRALIFQPKVLFLDEPFSALDYLTKWHVREFLYKQIHSQKINAFMISHDPEDCVFLSDKVLVLGQKPTTLLATIPIAFKNPRDFNLTSDRRFMQLQHEVVKSAYGESMRHSESRKREEQESSLIPASVFANFPST